MGAIDQPSRFIMWLRMQSVRQDEIGAVVRTVHEDPEVLQLRMYNQFCRYLHATARHQPSLPVMAQAVDEFDRYHKRQFEAMPCLRCRQELTTLPRADVDVVWFYRYGPESHTYGFLDKPCFVAIDSGRPFLGVETLDRLLNPEHGYTRALGREWRDALIRLWPLTKPTRQPRLAPHERPRTRHTEAAREGTTRPAMPGHVYLIHALGTDRVKIGRSNVAAVRFEHLKTASPYPLVLLRAIATKDMAGLERTMHHRYAHYRRHGEWFDLPPDVLAALLQEEFD